MTLVELLLYAYLAIGVSCCIALALAIGPRVWHNDRELMWLTAVCLACIPAWWLVIVVAITLQTEYVTELFTKAKDGA